MDRRRFLLSAAAALAFPRLDAAEAAAPALMRVSARVALEQGTKRGSGFSALYPSVAAHPNGGFLAGWTLNGRSGSLSFPSRTRFFDSAGNALSSVQGHVDGMTGTAVVLRKADGIVAGTGGATAVRRIDGRGNGLAAPIDVTAGQAIAAVAAPLMVPLTDGGAVVAWSGRPSGKLKWFGAVRLLDAAGAPRSKVLQVCGQSPVEETAITALVPSGSGALVGGFEATGTTLTMFVRRIEASGALGAKIVLASYPRAGATGFDLGLADLGSGRFLAAWTAGGMLRGGLYSAAGSRTAALQAAALASAPDVGGIPVVAASGDRAVLFGAGGVAFVLSTTTGTILAGPLKPGLAALPRSAALLADGRIAVASFDANYAGAEVCCLALS